MEFQKIIYTKNFPNTEDLSKKVPGNKIIVFQEAKQAQVEPKKMNRTDFIMKTKSRSSM
jgi:hypothetical protein